MPLESHQSQAEVLPRRLASRFDVTRLIAHGWLTRTWEVVDKTTGERRALKILHPHLASLSGQDGRTARALEAYRASVALHHPAFVTSHDLGPVAIDGAVSAFLLTEYVDGRSLCELVGERPLDLEATTSILTAVTDALEQASPHGPHLGLCPRNVLLQTSPTTRIRITDHGLLLALHREVPTLALERPERSAWLAPEQLSGRHSGAQTDMWAIGGLLRFALTGASPTQSIAPDTLPPQVKRLIRWLMHPDPLERPDRFDTVRLQLVAIGQGVDELSNAPTLNPRNQRTQADRSPNSGAAHGADTPPRRWLYALAAAAAVTAAAALLT